MLKQLSRLPPQIISWSSNCRYSAIHLSNTWSHFLLQFTGFFVGFGAGGGVVAATVTSGVEVGAAAAGLLALGTLLTVGVAGDTAVDEFEAFLTRGVGAASLFAEFEPLKI
ncbi:MAG: hypothetical protein IPG67_03030 [Acidobacteria bacterium]|nr:hypothetical protein [Acidobacteriota bacterium]